MKPTHKERAEAYVREKCPELVDVIGFASLHEAGVKRNRPIQLQHWLRVLPKRGLVLDASANFLYLKYTPGERHNPRRAGMSFGINLTTGQPATEADYQAFNQIVYGN